MRWSLGWALSTPASFVRRKPAHCPLVAAILTPYSEHVADKTPLRERDSQTTTGRVPAYCHGSMRAYLRTCSTESITVLEHVMSVTWRVSSTIQSQGICPDHAEWSVL